MDRFYTQTQSICRHMSAEYNLLQYYKEYVRSVYVICKDILNRQHWIQRKLGIYII